MPIVSRPLVLIAVALFATGAGLIAAGWLLRRRARSAYPGASGSERWWRQRWDMGALFVALVGTALIVAALMVLTAQFALEYL